MGSQMLTSFGSERYISLYKLSLSCDGFNLEIETYRIWQYIKNTVQKDDIKIILVLKVV